MRNAYLECNLILRRVERSLQSYAKLCEAYVGVLPTAELTTAQPITPAHHRAIRLEQREGRCPNSGHHLRLARPSPGPPERSPI